MADNSFGMWRNSGSSGTKTTPQQFVSFTFNDPKAYSVSVVGSFNQWMPGKFRLEQQSAGLWKGIFPLKPGVYEYRYFVNGEWVDDPNARKTVTNPFGTRNAVLEVK